MDNAIITEKQHLTIVNSTGNVIFALVAPYSCAKLL